MIFDIIFAAVLLVLLILGIRRGGGKTLLSVLSLIGASVLSVLLSQLLAELFFNMFIRQSLVDKINVILTDSLMGDVTLTAATILAALPSYALSAMNYFGVSNSAVETYCAEAITSQTADTAEMIADAMKPSIVGAISAILGIVLFILLLVLFRWLSKPLSKIFKLPLIRTFDSVFGALLGLIEGAILVFVTVLLINILLPLFSGDWATQFESYMNSSYIVSLINSGKITSWIQFFTYNVEKFSNI